MQQYYQLKYMLLYLKQCITKITIKSYFSTLFYQNMTNFFLNLVQF